MLSDTPRWMKTKPSQMGLFAIFLYIFFFFNELRIYRKQRTFCLSQWLEVAFSFPVRDFIGPQGCWKGKLAVAKEPLKEMDVHLYQPWEIRAALV